MRDNNRFCSLGFFSFIPIIITLKFKLLKMAGRFIDLF